MWRDLLAIMAAVGASFDGGQRCHVENEWFFQRRIVQSMRQVGGDLDLIERSQEPTLVIWQLRDRAWSRIALADFVEEENEFFGDNMLH